MLFEMHCMLTHSIQYMHTLHMYISSCNENMEIEGAVWVLMDDILVTMNQVDLTRPSCIYLITTTTEGCLFAMSFLFNPKRVVIQTLQSLILCNFVYLSYWVFFIRSETDTFLEADLLVFLVLVLMVLTKAYPNQICVLHNVLCSTGSEVLQCVSGVSVATASVLPLRWCGSVACLRCPHSYS